MLEKQQIIVIGGSSGIGLEVARQAVIAGAHVAIAGRSQERLDVAVRILGKDRVEAHVADIGDSLQVKRLFSKLASVDHLVVTAADLAYGPIGALRESDFLRTIRSKLLGPIFAIQECLDRMRPRGSIILTTGIAARRPMAGGSAAAAINSALEGLGRAMALELAPIRVNMLSPGWTDTPIWNTLPGVTPSVKQERFEAMSKRLPVGRIGTPADAASAALFLMTNSFVTGTVLHVDGGHQLV
jgi:NAD(P)-dependent dehydrogenase (short-subunit alcohol dehydrogenase family)